MTRRPTSKWATVDRGRASRSTGTYGMGMIHPMYWFSFTDIATCDR